MQFCNKCGAVLNLLEFPDEELCYTCRKKQEATIQSPPLKPETPSSSLALDSLKKATLRYENEQLVLRSPEGWLLWSGKPEAATPLENIISRAEKILAIRQRRKTK